MDVIEVKKIWTDNNVNLIDFKQYKHTNNLFTN